MQQAAVRSSLRRTWLNARWWIAIGLPVAVVTVWVLTTFDHGIDLHLRAWEPPTADEHALECYTQDGVAVAGVSRYFANPTYVPGRHGITWVEHVIRGGVWHGFGLGELLYDQPVTPTWRRTYKLCLPLWFVTLIAGLPAFRMAYTRLRVASSPGTISCVGCGYDLGATPARCPECGKQSAVGPAE